MGRGTGDGGDVYRCQSAIFNRDPREISNTTKNDDFNTTPIPLHEHPLLAPLGGFGPMFSATTLTMTATATTVCSQHTLHCTSDKESFTTKETWEGGGGEGGEVV